MRKYPEEVKVFILENIQGTTTADLVLLVNARFGNDFTKSKMKSYKGNHGLNSGLGSGVPEGTATKKYPAEVREFIKNNYVGVGHQGMADLLNENFGTNFAKGQMKGIYARFKLNSGRTGRFPKGYKPPNAIRKGQRLSQATEFKGGQLPHNYKSVGTEILRPDGYVWVKLADPNKWRQKHVLVWEAVNGPRPKGYVVIFGDGDRHNFDLSNLILISQRQLLVLNRKGLILNNAELTKTGIVVADIYIKIADLKNNMKT